MGWLGDFLFGKQETEQVNPFTDQAWEQLGNIQNIAQQGLTGTAANMNYDPSSSFNMFMSQAPQLAGLAQGATSGLEQNLMGQLGRIQSQTVQNVASEFSGLGALYSGATRDVASQRASEAAQNAMTTLGQEQIGLTGQLYGQGMSNAYNSVLAGLQNNQMQFSTYANLLGGIGSNIAGFGDPTMVTSQSGGALGAVSSLGMGALGLGALGFKPFG